MQKQTGRKIRFSKTVEEESSGEEYIFKARKVYPVKKFFKWTKSQNEEYAKFLLANNQEF